MVTAFLLAVSFSSAGAQPVREVPGPAGVPRVLITSVNVVDAPRGVVHPRMDVFIVGGRIQYVRPEATDRPDATLVRGDGLYLMPGLIDSHVHTVAIGPGDPVIMRGLATHGVTSIRMACIACGDLDPRAAQRRVQTWNQEQSELRPSLLATGSTPFTNPRAAASYRSAPERYHRGWAESGLTFVKVFESTPHDIYFDVLRRTRDASLRVEGHLPAGVTVAEAVAAGHKAIDHVFDVLDGCTIGQRAARNRFMAGDSSGAAATALAFDEEACSDVADMLRLHGVAIIPTLQLQKLRGHRDVLDSMAAGLVDLPEVEREFWIAEATANRSRDQYAQQRALYGVAKDVVRYLRGRGVRVLAGSDTPFPFLLPGISLHDELLALREAGLSPSECLLSATLWPAEHYGLEDVGRVASGYRADLILLRANPLEDVRNTRTIEAVFMNGQWLATAGAAENRH